MFTNEWGGTEWRKILTTTASLKENAGKVYKVIQETVEAMKL